MLPSTKHNSEPGSGGRRGPNWALPFALFFAGFVILIVANKISVARLSGYLLKGVGVALCAAGFLQARRDRPSKR
jgi:predicted Kef-type K+ transport protein